MSNHRLLCPESLLAAVDSVLGAPPARSLVLLPVSDGRSSAVIRMDLPRVDSDGVAHAASAFVSNALGYALRVPGTSALVALVFREDPEPVAHIDRALVSALALAAHRAGTPLLGALWRSRSAWGAFELDPPHVGTADAEVDADADACNEARASPATRLASPGRVAGVLPDVPFVELGRIDPPERRPAQERLAFAREIDAARDSTPAEVEAALERRLRCVTSRVTASDEEETQREVAHDRVVIVRRLRSTAGREHVLAVAAFGPDGPRDLEGVWSELFVDGGAVHGEGLPSEGLQGEGLTGGSLSGRSLDGGARGDGAERSRLDADASHRAPRSERLDASVAVLEALRALAPAHGADVAACLAWLEWARGRSSRAAGYAEHALMHDPLHDLAALIAWMTGRGVVAPWFGRCA